MRQERRQYSRKTLNPLPYINLPSGNGGIVLDVSEQGLRFRALAPLEPSEAIRFWFTARSKLVSGIGKIVWFDEVKKTGGLRFTDLPYNALEQIRIWPHDPNLQLSISNDLTLHALAQAVSPSSNTKVRGLQAALASEDASLLDRFLPGSFGSKVRQNWLPVLRNALAELHALSSGAYLQKRYQRPFKTAVALFLGILISTTVYVRHRAAGELLIRLGTRLSGEANSLTPAPTVATQGPLVDDGSAYKSEVDGPAQQAAPQFVTASTGNTAKEISAETPALQAQETPAPLPKTEASGRALVVQVAALKEEVEARKLTDKLRQENFEAFVGTHPVNSLYRVTLGPYPDEASARIVLGKLKRAGFDSFIRRESSAERQGT